MTRRLERHVHRAELISRSLISTNWASLGKWRKSCNCRYRPLQKEVMETEANWTDQEIAEGCQGHSISLWYSQALMGDISPYPVLVPQSPVSKPRESCSSWLTCTCCLWNEFHNHIAEWQQVRLAGFSIYPNVHILFTIWKPVTRFHERYGVGCRC